MYALDPLSIYVGASFVALVIAGLWAYHSWRERRECRERIFGRGEQR